VQSAARENVSKAKSTESCAFVKITIIFFQFDLTEKIRLDRILRCFSTLYNVWSAVLITYTYLSLKSLSQKKLLLTFLQHSCPAEKERGKLDES